MRKIDLRPNQFVSSGRLCLLGFHARLDLEPEQSSQCNDLRWHSTIKETHGRIVPISGSSRLLDLIGYLGLDYVIVDMEHSSVDLSTPERMAKSASLTGLSLIVRVPKNDFNTALRVLDIGANGVPFPHVNTREDALAAVSATKY